MHRRNLFQSAGLLLAALFTANTPVQAKPSIKGAPFVQEPIKPAVEPLRGVTTIPQQAAYVRALGQDLRAEVLDTYTESDLLRVLPWLNIAGGAYVYTQEGWLPGVGFVGQEQHGSTGAVNEQVEILRIAGGDIDVDKSLIYAHGANIVPVQRKQFLRAQAYNVTNMLINGNPDDQSTWAEVPRAIQSWYKPTRGLKYRIVGPQLVNSRGALRVKTLDATIDSVDGPTHMLMAQEMIQRFDDAGLLVRETVDGAERLYYKGGYPKSKVEVLSAYEVKGKEPIIGFNEWRKTSSIYVMNLSDCGFCGLQNGIVEVDDLGYVQDRPVHRTRVEWLVSGGLMSGRAAARIEKVRNAPIVA